MRMYHLVAINEKSGAKTYLTASPATHAECCTMKSKFSHHPARRVQLEEVPQDVRAIRNAQQATPTAPQAANPDARLLSELDDALGLIASDVHIMTGMRQAACLRTIRAAQDKIRAPQAATTASAALIGPAPAVSAQARYGSFSMPGGGAGGGCASWEGVSGGGGSSPPCPMCHHAGGTHKAGCSYGGGGHE